MIHFLRKCDHIISQDDSSFDKQTGDTFFLKTMKMVQHRKTHLSGMEIKTNVLRNTTIWACQPKSAFPRIHVGEPTADQFVEKGEFWQPHSPDSFQPVEKQPQQTWNFPRHMVGQVGGDEGVASEEVPEMESLEDGAIPCHVVFFFSAAKKVVS